MKKILLLGGSAQQVIAIETARRLGYQTVLCDFLPDNPGQHAAHCFYLVSTTDKEAVLAVAKKEMVDGVLAYASDPAAPTAAYVAEKMGLPGNPYASVDLLCNKDKFRAFLREHDFCTPDAQEYDSAPAALHDLENGRFLFPVIVKPVDSSGSRGVARLDSAQEADSVLERAFSFSRAHKIIIEDFIEKDHPYLIGGDIFVLDGKVVLWGLMNCHRDTCVNALVPVGKSYPLCLSEQKRRLVQATLQRLVTALPFRSGEMNVELVVDRKDRVYLIDVGPRSGGNMIPDLLSRIFNVDLIEASVRLAMGQTPDLSVRKETPYQATYNVHARETGALRDIVISDRMKKHVIRSCIYKSEGDPVESFDHASRALGILFLQFEDESSMLYQMDRAEEWLSVAVNQNG